MTRVSRNTTQSFFEAAFKRTGGLVREYRVRRSQRAALVMLMGMGMGMDASRLNDLGLNVQDVADALNAQQSVTA